MRTRFLFRRPWLSLAGLASLIVVSSIAVHPFGSVKRVDRHGANLNDLAMPVEVRALFARSCNDCHSNQTVWPWYSYVAPTSWMVERDVHRGRDHMNLSDWPQYSLKRQEKLLANIASTVKNREMPLPQYLLVHTSARLSDAELDILYQWARLERRRVKAALASPSQAGHSIKEPIPQAALEPPARPARQ
jgi:hypothetical protein